MFSLKDFVNGFLIGALAATAGACIGAEVSSRFAPAPELQVVREICPEGVRVPTSTPAPLEAYPEAEPVALSCRATLDGMPMARCGRGDPACTCTVRP